MSFYKDSALEVIPIIVPERSPLRSTNFFLIKHGHSLSLIDTGWNNDECWSGLTDTLNSHGLSLFDLTEIILTHHHNDHIGLVNRIISKHPIPVCASPLSIPRLRRGVNFLDMRVEFFANLYKEMGCGEMGEQQVTYLRSAIENNKQNAVYCDIAEIQGSEFFHFGVVETPGHAVDQLAFVDQSRGMLFGGDLLFKHIASNALVEPDLDGQRLPVLQQHIDSLEKCASLDVEFVLPGHGEIITKPALLLTERLAGIEEKSDRIFSLIESGISTGSDLAQAYYHKRYRVQFSFIMSEIIGHLDYLEGQGKVEKEFAHGVWRYIVVNKK